MLSVCIRGLVGRIHMWLTFPLHVLHMYHNNNKYNLKPLFQNNKNQIQELPPFQELTIPKSALKLTKRKATRANRSAVQAMQSYI